MWDTRVMSAKSKLKTKIKSLAAKQKRIDDLWDEMEELKEQICKSACPFQIGEEVRFRRNGRWMKGVVRWIYYRANVLWECRVAVVGRKHQPLISEKDLYEKI